MTSGKVLVIGSDRDFVTKAQLDPFFYERRSIRRMLGPSVNYISASTFSEIGEICERYTSDSVFLFPFWNESADHAERAMEKIRTADPQRKIIFIDPFAQTSSNYFSVLPYVDWFLKRQRFKNLTDYTKEYAGGTMLTDFLVKQWGIDLEGWSVNSKIPAGYEHRIVTGWNLGLSKGFRQVLLSKSLYLFRGTVKKDVDIFCRLSLGPQDRKEWYSRYREIAIKNLSQLTQHYNVIVSSGFLGSKEFVSAHQYLHEIKRSRIVFSPFGWGETCWRDFEAICYRCLLIKPAMDHIDTEPNIFVPHQTYVPVKWDLSDLEEKCTYYLKHPDEAAQIVENAVHAYKNYFNQYKFVKMLNRYMGSAEHLS
jgi:hypothetical protein